jgi:hypothetical protein
VLLAVEFMVGPWPPAPAPTLEPVDWLRRAVEALLADLVAELAMEEEEEVEFLLQDKS